jgi:methylmalonyl-CoA/ethylmalonyl-CoA epimerase
MNKITHVGIIVTDLEKSIGIFSEILGCSPGSIEEIPDQKVKVAIFRPAGSNATAIELISPVSDESPVSRYLKKRGEGLHHISITVPDLPGKIDSLNKRNFRLVDEIARSGAEGRKIAFVHPSSTSGVLIELEQD